MSVLLLVLLLLLVAVNGLFVAAEFALVRARRSRLEAMAAEGAAGAERALGELERLDEYLSACQVGITMASIGIGFLGEPSLAQLLEPIFGGLSHGLAVAISVAIAYALVTAIHISVGEQVPKMLAITRAEGALRVLARPLAAFRAASAPFTVALTKAANRIVRLFGVHPGELEEQHTEEDVKAIIQTSARGGSLDPGEAGMLSGVFHLHEQEARDVPIFPETKPLDDLLAELQRQRSSLAVVSDEYGRTVGVITVEDILEEVVGEIEDETDPRADSMRRLTDGDWYVRGHVSLGDLEDVGIRLPVDSDAFNSIGGHVFSELGRLPKRGDRIVANGYEVRVESVRENRIVAVRIHATPHGGGEARTGEAPAPA